MTPVVEADAAAWAAADRHLEASQPPVPEKLAAMFRRSRERTAAITVLGEELTVRKPGRAAAIRLGALLQKAGRGIQKAVQDEDGGDGALALAMETLADQVCEKASALVVEEGWTYDALRSSDEGLEVALDIIQSTLKAVNQEAKAAATFPEDG